MKRNVNAILDKVRATIASHYDGNGGYLRWTKRGDLKVNEYGCADAANMKYIMGDLESDPDERRKFYSVLQAFQHDDGLFCEPTHHPIHCTAHCTAALELYDVRPLKPFTALEDRKTVEGLYDLLENLQWKADPWSTSHQGAGIYAAFIITRIATPEWQDAYFKWLDENNDPVTGIGRRDSQGEKPLFHHLNGWFHYMFNYNFARRPFPNANKLIDSCIDLFDNGGLNPRIYQYCGFDQIDWVFAINRASMQTGYRRDEVKQRMRAFAESYIDFMETCPVDENNWDDLHSLFGSMCVLAELQVALPGEIISDYPLKPVLDRRPFI